MNLNKMSAEELKTKLKKLLVQCKKDCIKSGFNDFHIYKDIQLISGEWYEIHQYEGQVLVISDDGYWCIFDYDEMELYFKRINEEE